MASDDVQRERLGRHLHEGLEQTFSQLGMKNPLTMDDMQVLLWKLKSGSDNPFGGPGSFSKTLDMADERAVEGWMTALQHVSVQLKNWGIDTQMQSEEMGPQKIGLTLSALSTRAEFEAAMKQNAAKLESITAQTAAASESSGAKRRIERLA